MNTGARIKASPEAKGIYGAQGWNFDDTRFHGHGIGKLEYHLARGLNTNPQRPAITPGHDKTEI